MNANNSSASGGNGNNQQQSRAMSSQERQRNTSSDADALPWRTRSSARARGVRRRREDSIEIEELDSDTMRQNSYNYFQRYARTSAPACNTSGDSSNSSSSASVAFTHGATGGTSPPLRTGSSRKRQRTLADRLEDLCLGGVDYFGRSSSSRSASSVNADVEMDGDDDDVNDDDDDRAESRSELMVYGGVPSMKGFFFGSARRKPMDRVFRHYAAVANQTASSAETSGNELVLFRRTPQRTPPQPLPTPYLVNLSSYLSLTPQELEALTRQEKSKRAAASVVVLSSSDDDSDDAQQRRMPMAASASGSSSDFKSAYRHRSGSAGASSTGSPPFRALGVPRTDSMEGMEDVDMDGEGDPRQPHLSGDVSHSEWFLDDGL